MPSYAGLIQVLYRGPEKMAMNQLPWDKQIARALVKALVKTPITANQITFLTLLLALWGAYLIASGDLASMNWGVGIFVLARFLDHCDGELARQKKSSSKLGYYLDYVSGTLSYGALFLSLGIGLRNAEWGVWELGNWAIYLSIAGILSAVIAAFINLDIDKLQGNDETGDAVGYPGYARFELEDGIYLMAPITWLGYLVPFFVAASVGSIFYLFWCIGSLWRLRRPLSPNEHPHKY